MGDKNKTLDQRRAEHAWKAIKEVVETHKQNGKPDETAKKYGTQAKQLPMRIMASGLGQALAFLKAKGYAPDLVETLNEWLSERIKPKPGESEDILERIINGDADFLRRATDEALAYLVWLNRFADAEGLTDKE